MGEADTLMEPDNSRRDYSHRAGNKRKNVQQSESVTVERWRLCSEERVHVYGVGIFIAKK